MKNINMVRNAKENKRIYRVYSNDEVKLRRLALMYKEFIPGEVTRTNHHYDINKYKYKVVMRMPAYERDDMMKNAGLRYESSKCKTIMVV